MVQGGLDLTLHIFAPHRLAARLRRLDHRAGFYVLPIAVVGLLVAAAAADGNLRQSGLDSLICNDLATYLRSSKLNCTRAGDASEMAALRDILSLLVLGILPLTIPLWLRQWNNIEVFLQRMLDRGVINVRSSRPLSEEVASCNRFFVKYSGLDPLLAGIAAVIVLLVMQAQQEGPVYRLLAADRHDESPSKWWLSMDSATWAPLAYFLVGYVVLTVILLQNLHGGRVVLLLWRIRHHVDFGANEENPDGQYGWSEASNILWATWTLIIIHGISIGLVALSLPPHALYAIVPVLAQWILIAPIFWFVPTFITARSIRRWKRERLRSLGANDHSVRQKVLAVKINPYAGLFKSLLGILGLVGTVAFMWQILGLLYDV